MNITYNLKQVNHSQEFIIAIATAIGVGPWLIAWVRSRKEIKLKSIETAGTIDLKKIEIKKIDFINLQVKVSKLIEDNEKMIQLESQCKQKLAGIITERETESRQVSLIAKILLNMSIKNPDANMLIAELAGILEVEKKKVNGNKDTGDT